MIRVCSLCVLAVNYSELLLSLPLGFFHTAFALRAEGRLDQSSHFNDHIPRGELVELLTKALLYTEVETHCKGDGLITDCKTSFSLLKRHVCTVEMDEDTGSLPKQAGQTNGVAETPLKRKANVSADGDMDQRRVKRSLEPEVPESSCMWYNFHAREIADCRMTSNLRRIRS